MKRYEALDALRGVAALAVLVFHLSAFGLGANLAPHAYLAVDFFFVLSGFVIAHAYGEALAGPLSWFDFARRRVIRLFPLALFGAVFGLAVLLLKWKLFPGREGALGEIVSSGLLNLLLLPSFFSGPIYDNAMFPGDGPLWSLFFEMAINLAWAGIAARWGRRRLVLLVVTSGACLTALAVGHGSTRMGVEPQSFWGGAARAAFGFTFGVLIYQWLGRFNGRARRGGAFLATAALGLAFCAPMVLVHSKSSGADLGPFMDPRRAARHRYFRRQPAGASASRAPIGRPVLSALCAALALPGDHVGVASKGFPHRGSDRLLRGGGSGDHCGELAGPHGL